MTTSRKRGAKRQTPRAAQRAFPRREPRLQRGTRKLPQRGPVTEDYEFEEGAADSADTQTVRCVKISELFRRDASLVIYSYMYGAAMAKSVVRLE